MTKKAAAHETCSSESGWSATRCGGFHFWLSELVFSLTPCSVFWLVVFRCVRGTAHGRRTRGEESATHAHGVWGGARSHFCIRNLSFSACLRQHRRPKTSAGTRCWSGGWEGLGLASSDVGDTQHWANTCLKSDQVPDVCEAVDIRWACQVISRAGHYLKIPGVKQYLYSVNLSWD